jgi:hypothetical protein
MYKDNKLSDFAIMYKKYFRNLQNDVKSFCDINIIRKK